MSIKSCMNGVFILVHGIKYTPLGISIVFNHEMIAHKLLDHPEIDVNKKTCESTALHYACLRNSVSLIEAICAKVSLKLLRKGSKLELGNSDVNVLQCF